ncbi:unnamed protein product, partial [Iphiclides podalirius]
MRLSVFFHSAGSRVPRRPVHPTEPRRGAAPLRSRSPWRPAQMTYRSLVGAGAPRGGAAPPAAATLAPQPPPLDRWPMQNDGCKVWIYLLGRK